MSEPLLQSIESGVAVLRLNAPERMNAISLEMREALIEAITSCVLDDDCNAIVITGEGGNFSAGGDIKGDRPAPKAIARAMRHKLSRLQEMIRVICTASKPVVALVEGKAFGAGMSLAIACDVVVASESAQFCAAFGRVGLVPDAGMFYTLPRRVGAARAQHLMLSARVVEADRAHALGLVDHVVAADDLMRTALAEAERLSNIAPLAFATIKSLAVNGCNSLDQAFQEEQRLQPLLGMTDDYVQARSAFAERRKPSYRGY